MSPDTEDTQDGIEILRLNDQGRFVHIQNATSRNVDLEEHDIMVTGEGLFIVSEDDRDPLIEIDLGGMASSIAGMQGVAGVRSGLKGLLSRVGLYDHARRFADRVKDRLPIIKFGEGDPRCSQLPVNMEIINNTEEGFFRFELPEA